MSRVEPIPRLLTAIVMPFLLLQSAAATAGPRPPKGLPRLVLSAPGRGERVVQTADLMFAFYERIYYQKRSPRSQDPAGRRLEIEDRRRECRCLRFVDWSKLKFKKLRQIEIRYPSGSRVAFLRITRVNGEVREFPASRLTGTEGPLPPRFGATIDGVYREFPLILGDAPGADWPEETLARVLLVAPRPARRSSSRRR